VSSGPADEIFTCALTQDLGVLALTNLDPNYCALIQECQNDHDKLIDCEKTLYGVDHATITAHLLDAWKLPTIFSMSAMGSHDPTTVATDIDASVLTLIHCISLSGIFADVFVAEDTRKNLEKARTLGEKYFGFNADQVSALLEGIREQVPEISELFDFKLLSRAALDAIVEEARSLLVKINLRALSEMQDSVQTIERLSEENRVLKNKADIDPLTEAFNRRFLKRYLKTAFFEAMTKERNLSCVFIDVDHFKRVNDQFGHDVGDRVLQSLVKEIKEIIRNNDVVVRYGGEEFVVVLRRVEPDVALGVAWRICKSIRGMTLTAADGSDVRVGVSIGVATHTPDDRFASADSLLRAADAALYEAKSKGRDRVVRYERQ
jgi:diguanylate cyclase (GGDEF)-like protein